MCDELLYLLYDRLYRRKCAAMNEQNEKKNELNV